MLGHLNQFGYLTVIRSFELVGHFSQLGHLKHAVSTWSFDPVGLAI